MKTEIASGNVACPHPLSEIVSETQAKEVSNEGETERKGNMLRNDVIVRIGG